VTTGGGCEETTEYGGGGSSGVGEVEAWARLALEPGAGEAAPAGRGGGGSCWL
jgi:hypothetical protein